jgi:hypothetical protein
VTRTRMGAAASHARGSLAVSLSHHQKEVWTKGIDTKNHIDGLLFHYCPGGEEENAQTA